MELLGEQVRAFAMAIGGGLLIGLLFDSYRLFRGWVRPGRWMTAVCDLLFWAVATPVLFAYLLLANWAELRLYVLVGVSLGLLCYYAAVSRFVIRGASVVGKGVVGGVAAFGMWVVRVAFAPVFAVLEWIGKRGTSFRRNRWAVAGAGRLGRIWPRG